MKNRSYIFSIVSDLEICKDGVLFLTPRAMELVKAVHETGSILSAAKEAHVAYPQAWKLLNNLNHVSPLPVIIRLQGGTHGGGTIVTPFGRKLLAKFEKLQTKYDKFILEMEEEVQDLCDLK
ncbi:MAG: LysR family transcriptional regulator [Tannerellaceae bacterium]|jgi:molybdate transport system regulatory protein|nr:LysR family transcriptional regulator [Tannerellaceae bacterium]